MLAWVKCGGPLCWRRRRRTGTWPQHCSELSLTKVTVGLARQTSSRFGTRRRMPRVPCGLPKTMSRQLMPLLRLSDVPWGGTPSVTALEAVVRLMQLRTQLGLWPQGNGSLFALGWSSLMILIRRIRLALAARRIVDA